MKNGGDRNESAEKLVDFRIISPNSKNSLERNSSSFHKVLTSSLRGAFVDTLNKALNSKVGTVVKLTIKFKLVGVPSDGTVKPIGTITEIFSTDPSTSYYLVVYIPTVE